MLTTAEIQAELERVTFMPGWTITAYQGRWEGQHLQITTQVPDAYDPASTVTLDVHTFLPPIPDAEYLHDWITWRLARLAVHEVREFYRVDGKPAHDPHAPFADRDLG
jgi:hypothetical protein